MKVTRKTFPAVFEALNIISHDGGAQCWDWYEVPAPWDRELPDFEVGLHQLNAEELQTFCIGEQDEMLTIMAERGLDRASNFLCAFFDADWSRGRA